MKIVYASTPSQEEEISELIQYFYSNVFPRFFSDKKIREFEQLKVLHASVRHFDHFGTLREAFQVMATLQTMIFILETTEQEDYYESLFNKNVYVLREYGFYFPFEYEQFLNAKAVKSNVFSLYTRPANEMLI